MRRLVSGFFLAVVILGCNSNAATLMTPEERLIYDVNVIDSYLTENNIEAVKLESGVRYVIKEMGAGPLPTKDNCVRFKYDGYVLYETNFFDSNQTAAGGLKIALKSLISGMQIGLKQMPVGTKGTVFIPSNLGYGGTPQPGIPGYSILRFEVEVTGLSSYNSLGDYCN